jgi:hypothetical protein
VLWLAVRHGSDGEDEPYSHLRIALALGPSLAGLDVCSSHGAEYDVSGHRYGRRRSIYSSVPDVFLEIETQLQKIYLISSFFGAAPFEGLTAEDRMVLLTEWARSLVGPGS